MIFTWTFLNIFLDFTTNYLIKIFTCFLWGLCLRELSSYFLFIYGVSVDNRIKKYCPKIHFPADMGGIFIRSSKTGWNKTWNRSSYLTSTVAEINRGNWRGLNRSPAAHHRSRIDVKWIGFLRSELWEDISEHRHHWTWPCPYDHWSNVWSWWSWEFLNTRIFYSRGSLVQTIFFRRVFTFFATQSSEVLSFVWFSNC